MNKKEFKATLEYIRKHPEEWKQGDWHCGTTACFAGITVARHGWEFPEGARSLCQKGAEIEVIDSVARDLLGLTHIEAGWLFSSNRTLSDFAEFLDRGGLG